MSTQFQKAFRALQTQNTGEFNELYSKTNIGKKSLKRVPSQFQAAREALRAESPVLFNEQLNLSPRPTFGGKLRKRKTRKQRKMSRKTRRKN